MANLVQVCILYKKIVIYKIIFVESNIIEPIAIELNLYKQEIRRIHIAW